MSRQKANLVPLYSAIALSFDEKHVIKAIQVREAVSMRERNEVRMFCRSCGRGAERVRCTKNSSGQHSLVAQLVDRRRNVKGQAYITAGEAQANAAARAGFRCNQSRTEHMTEYDRMELERFDKPAEDFVERAVAKVDFYPITGDTKAIRVCPVDPIAHLAMCAALHPEMVQA